MTKSFSVRSLSGCAGARLCEATPRQRQAGAEPVAAQLHRERVPIRRAAGAVSERRHHPRPECTGVAACVCRLSASVGLVEKWHRLAWRSSAQEKKFPNCQYMYILPVHMDAVMSCLSIWRVQVSALWDELHTRRPWRTATSAGNLSTFDAAGDGIGGADPQYLAVIAINTVLLQLVLLGHCAEHVASFNYLWFSDLCHCNLLREKQQQKENQTQDRPAETGQQRE